MSEFRVGLRLQRRPKGRVVERTLEDHCVRSRERYVGEPTELQYRSNCTSLYLRTKSEGFRGREIRKGQILRRSVGGG